MVVIYKYPYADVKFSVPDKQWPLDVPATITACNILLLDNKRVHFESVFEVL